MIRPLGDKLLIRLDEKEEKTSGGIILQEESQEKVTKGTVIAKGKGRILPNGDQIPIDIEVGDKVIFGKYSGLEKVEVEGQELWIVNEVEIKGIIED
jgi:chaperonin GroES